MTHREFEELAEIRRQLKVAARLKRDYGIESDEYVGTLIKIGVMSPSELRKERDERRR
jgi:hypothetical protein